MQVWSANVTGYLRVSFDLKAFRSLEIAAKLSFYCDVTCFYVCFYLRARSHYELASGLNFAAKRAVDLQVAFELQPSSELDIISENCVDILHTLWNGRGPPGSRKMHEYSG